MRALWPTFEEYSPVRLIAGSTSAQLYEARGPNKKPFALKALVYPRGYKLTQQESQRLEIALAMTHENLLPVLRAEWVHSALCLVMPYASRSMWEEFRDVRQQGMSGLTRRTAIEILKGAAAGLDFLHQRYKAVHRAVKPENILLESGVWKLADLAIPDNSQRIPWCTAPEVFINKETFASDQYSLAVLYVEMRTGRLPFLATSASDLCEQVGLRQPKLDGLDDGEREVLSRALFENPAERFPSCTLFIETLAGSRTTFKTVRIRPKSETAEKPTGEKQVPAVAADERTQLKPRECEIEPNLPDVQMVVEASAVRRLGPVHWFSNQERRLIFSRIDEFAAERGLIVMPLGDGKVTIELPVPTGAGRESVEPNSFLLHFQLLARRDPTVGWMTSTVFEHYDSPLSESEFEEAACLFLDQFASAVGLVHSETTPTRREDRQPFQASVQLVPRSGAYRQVRMDCETADVSKHGLSIVVKFPVSQAAADLWLSTHDEPIPVRLLSTRKRNQEPGFTVGMQTLDGQPLPPEFLKEAGLEEIEGKG